MAGRIRTLKPEILDNAKTAGLSDTAFRLFVALILEADDHGNGYGDVRRLKSRVWWAAEPAGDVATALAELVEAGLVSPYEAKGQAYAALTGWRQHQKVDKPGRPRVPGPEREIGDRDRRSEIGDRSRDPIETPANVSGESRETPANVSAVRVLEALSAARIRVIPGARPMKPIKSNLHNISARLDEGASIDDCLHVIAVREADVRSDADQGRWFDAVTPFTKNGFSRAMAQPVPRTPADPVIDEFDALMSKARPIQKKPKVTND